MTLIDFLRKKSKFFTGIGIFESEFEADKICFGLATKDPNRVEIRCLCGSHDEIIRASGIRDMYAKL